MKKTAVVLDDLDIRHEAFEELFGEEYEVTHLYNFTQFFHHMTTYPGTIDLVSLDHDLGDHTYGGNPTGKVLYGTGTNAVRLLEILPPEMRPLKVKIHSHNYTRSEIMEERLLAAGYDTVTERFSED